MKKLLVLFLAAWAVAAAAQPLRLMSYNVRTARGMDGVLEFDRTAEAIRRQGVDAVALQELDSATRRSNGLSTGEELAKRLGMHFAFAPAIEFDGGRYGIGLLSKEKPLAVHQISLPGRSEARTALYAELPTYVVVVAHFSFEDVEERMESVRLVAGLIDSLGSTKPIFVCGDLNALPDDRSIALLSERAQMLNDPDQPTFPAAAPIETIDYLFLWNNGAVGRLLSANVPKEPTASDHRPVVVEIDLTTNR